MSAHQVIPHDHHIDNVSVNQDKTCPVQNNDSRHHPGFPAHCHAFNDITSEKSRVFQISQSIQLDFLSLSILPDNSTVHLRVTSYGLADLHKPFIDPCLLEFSLLRAPPAAA